jgi:hypothetical protein
MKDKKTCSLVLTRNNTRLAGTAAQLAHISELGGWDAFLQSIAEDVVARYAQTYNAAASRASQVVARAKARGAQEKTP